MVPFDGSPLSEAALAKARMYAIALDEAPAGIRKMILSERPLNVVAVSIVPESARYAREMGWIDEDEEFRTRLVIERLHSHVAELDPSAEFRFERVDGAATSGTISSRLRQKADEIDADVIFIGSENAGRIITPITSVGSKVTAEQTYDVCIVRHRLPSDVEHLLKSDFS